MPGGHHSARADLARLREVTGDASPFRTAVRNIIAACRNSPLALAAYCHQGVLPSLAAALQQVRLARPWHWHAATHRQLPDSHLSRPLGTSHIAARLPRGRSSEAAAARNGRRWPCLGSRPGPHARPVCVPAGVSPVPRIHGPPVASAQRLRRLTPRLPHLRPPCLTPDA